MVGIPGCVGGAVWMNAGVWGHEIGERLQHLNLSITVSPDGVRCRIKAVISKD